MTRCAKHLTNKVNVVLNSVFEKHVFCLHKWNTQHELDQIKTETDLDVLSNGLSFLLKSNSPVAKDLLS